MKVFCFPVPVIFFKLFFLLLLLLLLPGPYVHMATIGKELTIKGLAVFAHYHRFPELYKDYIEPVAKVIYLFF